LFFDFFSKMPKKCQKIKQVSAANAATSPTDIGKSPSLHKQMQGVSATHLEAHKRLGRADPAAIAARENLENPMVPLSVQEQVHLYS